MLNKQHYMENYSANELQTIIEVIQNGRTSIIRGDILEEFEQKISKFMGHQYALATCNGTSAIFLSLYALGIGCGDEVILPVFAFHAMGVAVCHLGATPVFCDINQNTLTMDIHEAEKLITKNTKAILVLHPWGNLVDIDELEALKRKYPQISFISDSSHAHGALWNNKPLGNFFDIIAVSFGKGKLISGGELGALTTNNKTIQEKAMQFSQVNRVPKDLTDEKLKEINNAVGLKMRPHGVALQLGLINLNKFTNYFKRLSNNIKKFESLLNTTQHFRAIEQYKKGKRSYWKFPIFVNFKDNDGDIEDLLTYLQKNGVMAEKNNYAKLLNENTIFTQYYNIDTPNSSKYPNAVRIRNKVVQFPEFLFYDLKNVNYIFNLLNNFSKRDKKND